MSSEITLWHFHDKKAGVLWSTLDKYLGRCWKRKDFLRKGTCKVLLELGKVCQAKMGTQGIPGRGDSMACLELQIFHPRCSIDQGRDKPGKTRLEKGAEAMSCKDR